MSASPQCVTEHDDDDDDDDDVQEVADPPGVGRGPGHHLQVRPGPLSLGRLRDKAGRIFNFKRHRKNWL